jgi:uncharacterized protein (DUF983 family)
MSINLLEGIILEQVPNENRERIPASSRGTLASIMSLLCPRCHEGKVFGNMFLNMHEACPSCNLHFEREPGYFLGAMYFSYGLAIPPLAAMTIGLKLLKPEWSMQYCIMSATVVFLPLVIPIVRYSRVMWLHFDRFFDPHDNA